MLKDNDGEKKLEEEREEEERKAERAGVIYDEQTKGVNQLPYFPSRLLNIIPISSSNSVLIGTLLRVFFFIFFPPSLFFLFLSPFF
jgi:hypothetical protein